MINKPIYKWKEQDLQELKDKRISESFQLEYKETIDISTKGEKKELCKDVSAMANAFGGKIIYGIKESKQKDAGSIPEKLTPIKDSSLKESMQQVITDGILPRMDFQIYSFESPSKPGYEYVIIDIPQTLRGPHFVCLCGENRFYKRRDFESKKMDQREIEDAYRNFFFQEMKMNNLYDQIKKENPNISKAKGQPESAYCFLYFIPQYPIEDLFYKKFNHSKLTDRVVSLHTNYLKAYNDNFENSYDGLTNIRKHDALTERQDVYFRNGCVLYSFSLYNNHINDNGKYYISLDSLTHSLLKILNVIPYLYKECDYIGNIQIILTLECIDNYTLYSQGIVNYSYSISEGRFESKLQTSIDKLITQPKKELQPLLTHFIQSFGVYDAHINDFFDKVFFSSTFGER